MSIKKVSETYLDIKGNNLPVDSMLNMFNILKDENDVYFMNIFKDVRIDDDILNNQMYLSGITIVDPWWENISYSYYGSIYSWWMLCIMNNILNPFEDIVEAGTLTVLPKNFLTIIQNDMLVINNLGK
jgi:hypothetical protein